MTSTVVRATTAHRKNPCAEKAPTVPASPAGGHDIFRGPRNAITYAGVTYRNLSHLCDSNGLDYKLVWRRLQKDPSISNAAKEPYAWKPPSLILFGTPYRTRTDACRAHGLVPDSVFRLVRQGRTLEDAITHLSALQKNYQFAGSEYSKLTSLAAATNVPYRILHFLAVDHGYSVPIAVEMLRAIAAPIVYEGQQYDSLKHVCDTFTLNMNKVRSEFYSGKSLPDSIDAIRQKLKPRVKDDIVLPNPLVIRGITLSTLDDVANHYAISKQRLFHLVVERKIEVLAAIKQAGRRFNPEAYFFDGIKHDDIASLARWCNLPYRRLYALIVEKCLDVDTAVERVREEMATDSAIQLRDGSRFATLKSFCSHFDVSRTSLGREMERNPAMTFEDAAEAIIARRKPNSRKGKRVPVTYEGIDYQSLRSLCTDIGINYNSLHQMVKKGTVKKGLISFDEAIAVLRRA